MPIHFGQHGIGAFAMGDPHGAFLADVRSTSVTMKLTLPKEIPRQVNRAQDRGVSLAFVRDRKERAIWAQRRKAHDRSWHHN